MAGEPARTRRVPRTLASVCGVILSVALPVGAADRPECEFHWNEPIMGGGPLTFAGSATNIMSDPDTPRDEGWIGTVIISGPLGGDAKMKLEGTFPADADMPITELAPAPPDRISEAFYLMGTVTDPNCRVEGRVPVELKVDLDWQEMTADIELRHMPGASWQGCCSGVCGDYTEWFSFPLELDLTVPLNCAEAP